MTSNQIKKPQILAGLVVSAKMKKTVVVEVRRLVRHPKYGKYITRTKRYKAHDELGRCRVGDQVQIKSTRPLARDKFFIVL